MSTNPPPPGPRQKIFETLRDDVRRGDFFDSVRKEVRDTREFLLDGERRAKLKGMNPVSRWLHSAWWMLKAMFFRLTPARRLLFVFGLLMLFFSFSVTIDGENVKFDSQANFLGVFCIVLVLMLELKDKLVAREELDAGRVVQDALQPERSPALPGWDLWLLTRPANDVGGDLVDFVRLGDGRAAAVIGDVAGKGLRAALLMAKLQASVRAVAEHYTSLDAMAVRLNGIFCRDSLRNIFASMIYVELGSAPGELRFVNAGHIPPMVVRDGTVAQLPKGGAALGITPSAEYGEESLTLGDGDLFCAWSDGLSEAQNGAGEFFGDQRIREILARNAGRGAEAAGNELVNVVDRFVGEARRRDDMTLVVIARAAAG